MTDLVQATTASKTVLVSYTSADWPEVDRLIVTPLRRAGVVVWVDKREVRAGDDYDAVIGAQVEHAALVVAVWGAERPGNYMYGEALRALELGRCVPVRLVSSRAHIPFYFWRLHTPVVNDEASSDRLVEDVLHKLRLEPPRPSYRARLVRHRRGIVVSSTLVVAAVALLSFLLKASGPSDAKIEVVGDVWTLPQSWSTHRALCAALDERAPEPPRCRWSVAPDAEEVTHRELVLSIHDGAIQVAPCGEFVRSLAAVPLVGRVEGMNAGTTVAGSPEVVAQLASAIAALSGVQRPSLDLGALARTSPELAVWAALASSLGEDGSQPLGRNAHDPVRDWLRDALTDSCAADGSDFCSLARVLMLWRCGEGADCALAAEPLADRLAWRDIRNADLRSWAGVAVGEWQCRHRPHDVSVTLSWLAGDPDLQGATHLLRAMRLLPCARRIDAAAVSVGGEPTAWLAEFRGPSPEDLDAECQQAATAKAVRECRMLHAESCLAVARALLVASAPLGASAEAGAEAVRWAERARDLNPEPQRVGLVLAEAYLASGRGRDVRSAVSLNEVSTPSLRTHAALLMWLGSRRSEDLDTLRDEYDALPVGTEQAAHDDGGNLKAVSCPMGAEESASCRMLRVLLRPKSDDTVRELEALRQLVRAEEVRP